MHLILSRTHITLATHEKKKCTEKRLKKVRRAFLDIAYPNDAHTAHRIVFESNALCNRNFLELLMLLVRLPIHSFF